MSKIKQASFAFDPSASTAQRPTGAYGLGVVLPINAVVVGGFYEVHTAFTSANGNNGTIAISVNGANDILTATAVSDAGLGTIGRKAIVPKASTPESTSVKCTAAREVTATVAVSALTAGRLTGHLWYVVTEVSA